MDELAASMRQRFEPAIGLDVVNRTGLPGPFDVSLEFFRPAAALMALTPSLRLPLEAAGFQSVPEALEEQLGLTLVPDHRGGAGDRDRPHSCAHALRPKRA